MGRRKRKHIYIKDPELQKKIEILREMFPDMTYDEILKAHINIPTSEEILGKEYFEFIGVMRKTYKDPKIANLASFLWVILINSAKGDFDIQRIMYDLEKSIALGVYRKKKDKHHVHG